MSAGEYCNREVIITEARQSIRDAAKLMRQQHVGTVVIVEHSIAGKIPQGMLTDRDIVVELLAQDVDPDAVAIGDVMSTALITVNEETKLLDALRLMRENSVRRLIVVERSGALVGILSLDDVIELIHEQLADVSALISNEVAKERKRRV